MNKIKRNESELEKLISEKLNQRYTQKKKQFVKGSNNDNSADMKLNSALCEKPQNIIAS